MFKEIPWTIGKNKEKKVSNKKVKKNLEVPKKHTRQAEDLVGKVFGKLTVIKRIDNTIASNGRSHVTFLCRCECGKTKRVWAEHLKNGGVKSCGCARTENGIKQIKKAWKQRIEKEVQKRVKQENKKKNKKSFSFKFFNWTITIKN